MYMIRKRMKNAICDLIFFNISKVMHKKVYPALLLSEILSADFIVYMKRKRRNAIHKGSIFLKSNENSKNYFCAYESKMA